MLFHKLRRGFLLVLGLALLLAVVGLSYGYLKRVPEIYGLIHPIDQGKEMPDEIQHVNQQNKSNLTHALAVEVSKIDTDSTMVLERLYTTCNHVLIEEHPMESRYTGKTEQEMAAAFPEWQLKHFTSNRVVFLIKIESFCPDHYIIKEEDGFLVIFRPDKDTGLPLVLEATNIPFDRLNSEMQEMTTGGIVVDSIEEVEQLLENWES